jgi:predicted nucleic acid-binding protein
MRYFDTSFLVPLVLTEPNTPRVTAFFFDHQPEDLVVSLWTMTEFSSLVARQVRMRQINQRTAGRAEDRFSRLIADSFSVLTPTAADFHRARQLLGTYETGLRAGDALHLAIAANNHAEMVYSLDLGLIQAASLLGIAASLGIE